jgi:hypothetical protein
MLHSLFEHWPVTKQALGISIQFLNSIHLITFLFILETNDGYAERIHLDNLCHLPGHTPIFVG